MSQHLVHVTHVDDVWWYEAPLPRRWHRCRMHTSGMLTDGPVVWVDRCACGAIRLNEGPWMDRNQRRRR